MSKSKLSFLVPLILLISPMTAPAEEPAALDEPPISPAERMHWAYRPLLRPQPPEVSGDAANPIDRFILARLAREGLAPLPIAERRTLLRRITLDLTGLPPRPDEIAAFLADDTPDAYQRVVDRLLASPVYGERWAQHWLDLARFAETDGFEHDKVRPDAWRYRDWVIDALNRDLPLDEFIQLQIAGDELRPDDPQAAIATGFLLAGPDMPDINLPQERRHNALNEIAATVGSTLLGLQVGCAQCHDHKFDPISQADFYRLRAIFESAELFKTPPIGRVVQESGTVPVCHLMLRGDFRRPGPVVEPAFPRIANLSGEAISPAAHKPGGRRAALARWLTSGQPLTPRVLVNWIWQQHFGAGLSRTPGDFGVMGDAPSHPQLLDWLATQLVEHGWSLKRMHRLLVLSAAYRRSSRATSSDGSAEQLRDARACWQRGGVAADPQNRLWWRMNRRRLEGEAVRDCMLAAAESLSQGRGGAGIMARLPNELVATLVPGQWKADDREEAVHRRSVYLFVRRNLRYPLFEVLDRPDTNASCPRRNISTTAPQALAMLNSEFSLSAARELAACIARHSPNDASGQSKLLYESTLGRPPSDAELAAATAFLLRSSPASPNAADPPAALVELCLAMFNLNEFIYID